MAVQNMLGRISATIMIILTVLFLIVKYFWNWLRCEEQSVDKEIVLITGAAGGIGKEIALQYGKQGATVICVDRNKNLNEETVSELKTQNIKAHAYTCNVANFKDICELQKKVENEVGPVTILIANAGIGYNAPLDLWEEKYVKKVFDVNLLSVVWLLKAFLPGMKKLNKGHVVAIASISGLAPAPVLTIYSVSKKAVAYLMRAVREETDMNVGNNVKFTTIYPDFTATNMVKSVQNDMPLMLSPERVAQAVIKAQKGGKLEASIPAHYLPVSKFLNLFPTISGLQINYWMGKLEGIGTQRAWGNVLFKRD